MADIVKFHVNSKEFDAKVQEALTKVSDLRPAFIGIAREFYKANKAIFALKGPGRYTDFVGPKIGSTWSKNGILNFRTRNENYTAYQWQKEKETGMKGGYPLLKYSGRLEKSITEQGSADSILEINKSSVVLGTRVPYAGFHQEGTKNIPMRQFLFVDPSTTAWANLSVFSRRNVAWIKSIDSYVFRIVNKAIGSKPTPGDSDG